MKCQEIELWVWICHYWKKVIVQQSAAQMGNSFFMLCSANSERFGVDLFLWWSRIPSNASRIWTWITTAERWVWSRWTSLPGNAWPGRRRKKSFVSVMKRWCGIIAAFGHTVCGCRQSNWRANVWCTCFSSQDDGSLWRWLSGTCKMIRLTEKEILVLQ